MTRYDLQGEDQWNEETITASLCWYSWTGKTTAWKYQRPENDSHSTWSQTEDRFCLVRFIKLSARCFCCQDTRNQMIHFRTFLFFKQRLWLNLVYYNIELSPIRSNYTVKHWHLVFRIEVCRVLLIIKLFYFKPFNSFFSVMSIFNYVQNNFSEC